mgnify:CR=1 FL=1
MTPFVVRDTAGNILRVGLSQPEIVALQAEAPDIAEEDVSADGLDCIAHYYNGSAYVDKLVMPIVQDVTSITADGVDLVTFTGIPVGTEVDGITVDDGVLEFSTNAVGVETFRFTNNPVYIDVTLEVDAV